MVDKLKKILELASGKTDGSEIFHMKTKEDSLSFTANKLTAIENSQSEGMALRVKNNGKIGFATSTVIDEKIIEKAVLNSEFGETVDYDFSSGKVKFYPKDYLDKKIENINPASFIDKGMEIIEKLKKFDNRLSVDISFSKIFQEVALLTSSGFSGEYIKNFYSQNINAQIVRKNDIFNVYHSFSDNENMEMEEKIIEDILFFLENGMDIVKVESGKYPVIFTPEALENLLKILVFALNGYQVYRKISPLHTKLNRTIFDERLTIYDDSAFPGVDNFLPFDDEGVPAEKITLIEKGILRNFLLDLKYGKELNMKSTGNSLRKKRLPGKSFRGHNYYPSIYPTTIIIEPGNISSKMLLANIQNGILIKSTPNIHMGNIQNGDFSGNLMPGYKIEKGKIKGRIKNTVITGNIFNLLKDQLLEISSDRKFSRSSEYKIPYMLFKDVDITS